MGDLEEKYGRGPRTEGNPNKADADRELSRMGSQRTPDDIPKQDTIVNGRVVPGNVNPSLFQPSTYETWTSNTLRSKSGRTTASRASFR